MKKYKGLLIAILVCCVSIVGCEEGEQMIETVLEPVAAEQMPAEVNLIPDANLAIAVRERLGLPEDALLTVEVLQNLKELGASDREIIDLTGLEYAVNLTYLDLGNSPNSETSNRISDISPLANLTELTRLDLDFNDVSNVSALANLTKLTSLDLDFNDISNVSTLANLTRLTGLYLWGNQISDISPLANLTELTRLDLASNQVFDISPLANLIKLIDLYLWGNQISDISPLANLTKLALLSLNDNQVSDIAPLVANTGVDIGDHVRLQGNPLNEAAINTHIPALQAKGVTVER